MTAIAYSPPIRTPVPKRRATTRAGQGRLEKILPTPELIRHKAIILGGKINRNGEPIGFDIHQSIFPLDVYLRSEIIAPRHHKAGMIYARDRQAVFGATAVSPAGVWRQVIPSKPDADELVEELTDGERQLIEINRAKRLREATWLLADCAVLPTVRVVVLEQHFIPPWHFPLLRLGLERLAREWRIGDET